MKKTQYIKGKDGKFAGSIGAGKSAVPTPSPVLLGHIKNDRPETQPTPSTQRSQDLHHFTEAHIRGWYWLAECGTRPSSVTGSDFITSTSNPHPIIERYPHLEPYLKNIRPPHEIEDMGADLDNQPAQSSLLIELSDYGDDLSQLSEVVRGYCWQCESLEGSGHCDEHQFLGNLDIEEFLNEKLPEIDKAVIDDFLPLAGNDPESAAVVTGLVPNPFRPNSSDGS